MFFKITFIVHNHIPSYFSEFTECTLINIYILWKGCHCAVDKAVTLEDAEGVIGAEIWNKLDMSTTPGGLAASIAAAARLNQSKWYIS